MCGIAGIILRRTGNLAPLMPMLDVQAHRGPDGAGLLWADNDACRVTHDVKTVHPEDMSGRIGLAHRRLAILDLSSAAAQPMASTDGRFHIVCNGEIYNYIELKEELKQLGFAFR